MAKQKQLEPLGHKEAVDVQIATGVIGLALESKQGIQQIGNMLKTAKDPTQVIAHAIFMAMFIARKQLAQKGITLNPKIWVAKGGVVDRVIFSLVSILISVFKLTRAGTPGFVAALKDAVMELMKDNEKAMNSSSNEQSQGDEDEQEQGPPQAGAPQSPPNPQQAPPGAGLVAPLGAAHAPLAMRMGAQ